MKQLDENIIQIHIETSKVMTGSDRRAYQAKITQTYFDSSARQVEKVFGWSRRAVDLGLMELAMGYTCTVELHERGNKKTENKNPQLWQDILALIEHDSQVDPKFQSPFLYTRITARAIHQALIDMKGYTCEQLPTVRTVNNILNRMGYKLRRVQKSKPLKKIKETDAIFDNIKKKSAVDDPKVLRISIDTKAKVDIGELSRGGQSRGKEAKKALDHDMNPLCKLVPAGILEVEKGQLTTVVGNSFETSDFIVDGLQIWWDDRKVHYSNIEILDINLDNGPSISSRRTQFIKRMTEFSNKNSLIINLIYYPPYYSKYNLIERCWGILENHWNGATLDTVVTALEWIKTMTWKNVKPIVHFLDQTYKKGITLSKKEMRKYNDKVKRSESLPQWDLIINSV